jgi:dTDP-4-dehydrorhamnose reductase
MTASSRILLLGATGQIGHALHRTLPALGTVYAPPRADVDMETPDALRRVVERTAPDAIVNAAAYTAVDQAEEEPERAETINCTAPGILAAAAAARNAWMVHYSTDYVFDGTKRSPYTEEDPTAPLGVYGRTKRDGEAALQASGSKHLILRTSWVYSLRRSNFLRTMLRLADERDHLSVVDDQVGSPTWAEWIADATAQILEKVLGRDDSAASSGLYHLSSRGQTSWYGFARAIFKHFDRSIDIDPIASEAYPTRAERPRYSVLDTRRVARRFDLQIPSWTEQLAACVRSASSTAEAASDA